MTFPLLINYQTLPTKNIQKGYGYLEYIHNQQTRHKQASFTEPYEKNSFTPCSTGHN